MAVDVFVNYRLPASDYRLRVGEVPCVSSVRLHAPEPTPGWTSLEHRRLRTGAGVGPGDLAGLVDLVAALWTCRREGRVALLFSSKLVIVGPPIARLLGVRTIVTVTGFGRMDAVATSRARRLLRSIYRRSMGEMLGLAEVVLVQKHADRDEVARLSPRAGRRTAYIGSGTDVAGTDGPPADRSDLPGPTTVLLAARLHALKGVPEFLEVARAYAGRDDVRFVLAGEEDPNDRATGEAVRRAVGDGVVDHLGYVPHDRIEALLAERTVVLFPSHAEGMSRLVLEAAARGCPLVATRIPANVEAVGEDGALFCEVGDAAAMHAALDRLLDEPSLWRDLTSRARARVLAEFSFDAYLARLGRVLCGAPPDGPDRGVT